MNISPLQYILTMGLYIIILMFCVSLMRKYYRATTFIWIGCLLTLPLWVIIGIEGGWFRWVKILSVIIPLIFHMFTRIACYEKKEGRIWRIFRSDGMLWFLYGILFLNIAEATLKDFTLGNYANGAVGCILCATIPFAPEYWGISDKKYGDLISYTTVGWNFLYTTWNMAFVYAEGPTFFASSVCILLAAELYPILKGRPELYVAARSYTLGIHLMIRTLLPGLFPKLMDSSAWFNPTFLKYWGIINLVVAVPYLFWHMWQLHTGKARVSFRRGRVPEDSSTEEELS